MQVAPHPGQTMYYKVSRNKMRLKKRRSFYITNLYYYTSLPLNLAKQASKQASNNKQFSFPF